MTGSDVTVLRDPDQVVAALSAFRREVLAALDQPYSATELAGRLGTTRQRVNYHLRALEDAGFVELYEERQRRGLVERVMRRSSEILIVDPAAFDTSGLSRGDVAGVSGVVAVAMDLIQQAAAVAKGAQGRSQRIAAATLDGEVRLASPGALRALLDEIGAVIARYDSGDEGLRLRVATAVLPGVDES